MSKKKYLGDIEELHKLWHQKQFPTPKFQKGDKLYGEKNENTDK